MKFLKQRYNKFFRSFGIYLGSTILNSAIPFLFLPVLTRFLSPEGYGLIGICQVILSFSMAFVGMNMQNNITRNFYKKDKSFITDLIGNLFTILFISCSFVLLLCYFFIDEIFFSVPKGWVYLIIFAAAFNVISQFNLTILRNSNQPFKYGIFEVGRTFIDVNTTLLLIVLFAYGWQGRVLGISIASFTIGLISIYNLIRNNYVRVNINVSLIKEILAISLPLIPHSIGNSIMTLSDRLFIDDQIGTSAVGLYTVGYQFGMIILIICTAFNRAWSPWLYKELAKSNVNKNRVVRMTYFAGTIFLLLAFVLENISGSLLSIMTGENFHEANIYVGWVAYGYSFFAMYTLVFPYAVHLGRTNFLGIITGITAIINLILNYYLISLNGSIGAAQATLISYFLMFVSVWFYSNRLFPMPWFSFWKKDDSLI